MSHSKYRQQDIRAPRGTTLTAKSWLTEALLRMLMNNLDPDVAENPHELVVYGGIGRAARDWECYDAIVNAHNYRAKALAELPIGAQSLMKGDPVIPTEVTVL